MKPVTNEFYLVEHGEKEPGPGDPPLTHRGRLQARRTGDALRDKGITRIFCSPQRRARETASELAGVLNLPVSVDARLRERMNWGEGPPAQTRAAFLAEWERATRERDFIPQSGDSSLQTGARMLAMLEAMAARYPGEAIVLVGHGGATIDLLRDLFGDEYLQATAPELLRNGPAGCAITHLTRSPGGFVSGDLASVSHLSRDETE